MRKHNKNRKQCRFELVGDLVSIFQRGEQWYANYQHDGRQMRVSLKTTSKKEAQRKALRLEDRIKAGEEPQSVRPPAIAAENGITPPFDCIRNRCGVCTPAASSPRLR